MVTKGLITNLMICENIYLLCWTVPEIIMVLLVFSYFPTYSDLVLLPGFPLLKTSLLGRLQTWTLPNATPPIDKNHPSTKIAVTFEPIMQI